MLIGFSMIFVATKKYRDEELGGVIKFWTALKIGIGISLIAGIVYVAVWEINLFITDYEFIGEYTESIINKAQESGASPQKIEATIEEMEKLKKQYGKLWFRLPMTFVEIFPVGLIISLLSVFLLKNPQLVPMEQQT
tara:strand:+ start:216 stop:626 length:411 start_codon:yes stop_codon:yes gene_type:complete